MKRGVELPEPCGAGDPPDGTPDTLYIYRYQSEDSVSRKSSSRHPFIKYWLPILLYIPLIFLLSSIGTLRPPDILTGTDKIAHILEYGFLGFLLLRAFRRGGMIDNNLIASLVTLIIGLVVALADELFQSTVPGRLADPVDFAADALGLILAGAIFVLLDHYSWER
jgi:VanZ family protein